MKKRILIAEDDVNIRSGLLDALEMDGHEAHGVGDGAAAIFQFRQEKWDLLILDLMMPEKSGYEVAREVRATGSEVPILMLTAKSEEIDKVLGFEMGTDDYVTKPFSVRELLARIKALLRRSSAGSSDSQKSGAAPA
ncbi:MAG: response regulator transcription factor, partial [Opitutae bacterium]|nr:response regulator transcription factor [Opitutae bacterium]